MNFRDLLQQKRCLAGLGLLLLAPLALAQQPEGETLFQSQCANCHVQLAGEEQQGTKIPGLSVLNSLSANAIHRALTDGAMRLQGNAMTEEQRVAVSEYLGEGEVIDQPIEFEVGMCESIPPVGEPATGSVWNGWGNGIHNTRYQTETGGLTADDVPNLKLEWAFGIPQVEVARAQPTIYGDRLFMGSQAGYVYSLDAETGCTYWSFKAEGSIRTAMSVGPVETDGEERLAVFFNDQQGITYALEAETGEQLWSTKVDDHPAASGTGALTYHDGRLYVPTAGLSEEGIALGNPDYQCCSFRGSVSALDANTGEKIWQTFTVPEPEFIKDLENGQELWGPAGVAVWTAPTIDEKRNRVYIATGNAYVGPPVGTSNAVMALNLDTGEVEWVNQTLEEDIWSGGCEPALGGNPDNPGCADPVGPDFDFSASPALTTTPSGKEILVATQKSGLGFAFDPDDNGKTLWEYRWGEGAAAGGVYGTATDGEQAYFAVADNWTAAPGGLHAVDLETGKREWFTPPQDLLCNPDKAGCAPTQSAAVTAIEGVVFSTSADGGIRAYDTETGEVIWTYDTNRSFETVNGIEANGASMDGPGPVVANGKVYVTAGNAGPFGRPGNVLLVFSVE